jgi:hypothetical protein
MKMSGLQMPSAEHRQFDAICAEVADFEQLPTVTIKPSEQPSERRFDADDEPLDGLILAGLVVPY